MRFKSFGKFGVAAAGLALIAVALLVGEALDVMPQPWAPQASALAGIAAGLLGCLGLTRPARQPLPLMTQSASIAARDDTIDNVAALLRSMAEEMVRLRRDGAEASRSMADARLASTHLVEASTAAIARLDESAESSAIAARALSMLPGIADTHAGRIESLAERAEQALALVPDAMAVSRASQNAEGAAILAAVEAALAKYAPAHHEGLDVAIAHLDGLPDKVAGAMSAGMTQQRTAEAALLELAIARLEAAKPDPMLSVGLIEPTERLENVVRQFEATSARADVMPGPDVEGLAERLQAALAPNLAEMLSRRLTADVASRDGARDSDVTAKLGARLDGAMDRLSQDVTQCISAAMAEGNARPQETIVAGPDVSEMTLRLDAAAACMADLAQKLPDAVRDATTTRLDSGADDLRARCAVLVEALPEAILAQVEGRFGTLADGLTAASAGFPAMAAGLDSHLAALETLGPVLDGVIERLMAATDALSETGGSLQPTAEAARQAIDALSTAMRDMAQQERVKSIPELNPEASRGSVAASILGEMAEHEAPPMAATLLRLDGIGSEVASLLRETEGLVGDAGPARLSRPVAERAPEMLERLHETISGLQSISTAIAVAADRQLDHAQAS